MSEQPLDYESTLAGSSCLITNAVYDGDNSLRLTFVKDGTEHYFTLAGLFDLAEPLPQPSDGEL